MFPNFLEMQMSEVIDILIAPRAEPLRKLRRKNLTGEIKIDYLKWGKFGSDDSDVFYNSSPAPSSAAGARQGVAGVDLCITAQATANISTPHLGWPGLAHVIGGL